MSDIEPTFELTNELKYMKGTNNHAAHSLVYSSTVIGALADAFNKNISSIERWIKNGDDRLSSDKAKEVYDKYGWPINQKEKGRVKTTAA